MTINSVLTNTQFIEIYNGIVYNRPGNMTMVILENCSAMQQRIIIVPIYFRITM